MGGVYRPGVHTHAPTATGAHAGGRHSHSPPNPAGTPGPLRLFQSALGSQVSWLLPLALAGLVLLAGRSLFSLAAPTGRSARGAPDDSSPSDDHSGNASLASLTGPATDAPGRWSDWRRDPRTQGLLLWGMWLLAGGILFSYARSINAYYVAVLAPAIGALVGIGAVELWRAYCAPYLAERADKSPEHERAGSRTDWLALLAPLALLATAMQQAVLLGAAPGWRPWLTATLLAASLALACALCALCLWTIRRGWAARWQTSPRGIWRVGALATALATLALAATLIAPTSWTLGSLTTGNEGGWPSAGPQYASARPGRHSLVDPLMMRYLLAHRGEDRFIVGALNAYLTAPIIIATGQPVLDMGGFTGADPILTDHLLARLVARDQVHLFLLPSVNVTAAQQATLLAAPAQRGAARLSVGAPSRASAITTTGTAYTNALTRWISMHCAPVPLQQWSSASHAAHRLGSWQLFACKT
jgi:hypothetical protein